MVRLIALTVLALTAGCAAVQTESEQYLAGAFSDLETFAWIANDSQAGDEVRIRDERARKTVQDAIEQTLTAKGYRRVEPDQADFVVSWLGAVEQKIQQEQLDHLYSPYGYGTLFRDPALNTTSPAPIGEYEEGTIIIDLIDPTQNRLLWRGTAVGRIHRERPAETALKNLARTVSRILEPIPSR